MGKLDTAQKWATILSLVAIPVVLAIGGWWIQAAISQKTTDQEYVKLAVSILQSDKGTQSDSLRPWATSMLNKLAPVSFGQDQTEKLGSGDIVLPSFSLRNPSAIFITIYRRIYYVNYFLELSSASATIQAIHDQASATKTEDKNATNPTPTFL